MVEQFTNLVMAMNYDFIQYLSLNILPAKHQINFLNYEKMQQTKKLKNNLLVNHGFSGVNLDDKSFSETI